MDDQRKGGITTLNLVRHQQLSTGYFYFSTFGHFYFGIDNGHNNVGFSGGPVARRGTREEQNIVGIISGYRADRQNVCDEHGNKTSLTYDTNTGIIVAHDIRHALEIIERNPIGIPAVNAAPLDCT